jgi:hypothetical protein
MNNIEANIGEMLAVAMAKGGQTIANAACRFTNMTDACCLAGVKFPRSLNKEVLDLLNWFNQETSKMCEWWSESAEEARYCLFGEILVEIVEGKAVDTIREFIEGKLATIREEVRKKPREKDHYDDRYGFDEDSIYLKENNWGDKKEYGGEEDLDWWTRRAS